jgi:phospholipid/cholesterol/gamma-HCH transport system ATP-binding protein
MIDDDPAAEVIGLVTRKGDRRILNDVSLRVERGEILVIMGGSGSGKTTLLNHMLGLSRPDRGKTFLLGREIHEIDDDDDVMELRTRTGTAFQSGGLLGSLSVLDNVLLPLRETSSMSENDAIDAARKALRLVGLSSSENKLPGELSGGMTKRAAFARAIVGKPEILFCDEPSAGLDPATAAALDQLILRIRDETGAAVVVVTHDLDSAFVVADRICVLDAGVALAIGTREEIRRSSDPRIRALLDRRVELADDGFGVPRRPPPGAEEDCDPTKLRRMTVDDDDHPGDLANDGRKSDE